MDKRKLLIADNSEEFPQALSQALQSEYLLRCCQDGKEALSLLHSFQPDILVLELMLPNLDGISLLQQAARAGLNPMVLIATQLNSKYVVEATAKFNVGYIMIKPCDIQATVDRIRDLSQHLSQAALVTPDYRTSAADLLRSMGFSTKLSGYAYLRESIVLMAEHPDGMSITKELYPTVSKICGNGKSNVERPIRTAIDSAWARRNEAVWLKYFQPDSDGTIPRPTNGSFITRMAEVLRTTSHSPGMFFDKEAYSIQNHP